MDENQYSIFIPPPEEFEFFDFQPDPFNLSDTIPSSDGLTPTDPSTPDLFTSMNVNMDTFLSVDSMGSPDEVAQMQPQFQPLPQPSTFSSSLSPPQVEVSSTKKSVLAPKRGRPKKGTRPSPYESTDISRVVLTNEQLLNMSTADLERYAEIKDNEFPLSEAEKKHLNKYKRKIRNRENAQASRTRKRELVDELKTEVSHLKLQNLEQARAINELKEENSILQNALRKLQFGAKQGERLQFDTRGISTRAKQGVCLMIVLFACGLFLSQPGAQTGLQPRSPMHIPQVAVGRALKEYEPVASPNMRGGVQLDLSNDILGDDSDNETLQVICERVQVDDQVETEIHDSSFVAKAQRLVRLPIKYLKNEAAGAAKVFDKSGVEYSCRLALKEHEQQSVSPSYFPQNHQGITV